MANSITAFNINTSRSAKQITVTSLIALLLGHTMIKAYIPVLPFNFVGLAITGIYIYRKTLKNGDLFSFIMVIYFCSGFQYLAEKGGGFNLVGLLCLLSYSLTGTISQGKKKKKDWLFLVLLFLWTLSSILGWIMYYQGSTALSIYYSVFTFFGVIVIFYFSSRIEMTRERIRVFLIVNLILMAYSTIISLGAVIGLPYISPMLPFKGYAGNYIEVSGFIQTSPFYGEYSMILFVLFMVFYFFKEENRTLVKGNVLLFFAFIALLDVLSSISRSVLLLAFIGLAVIFFLQAKITNANAGKIFGQIFTVAILASVIFIIINQTRLGYVFDRLEEISEKNAEAGGITWDRIMDGTAFNRETSVALSKEKYESKDNWIVGNGWGIRTDNSRAFFVDKDTLRSSAHSQIYAIFFLFGWMGTVGYWGLLLIAIWRSYKTLGDKKLDHQLRVLASFFFIGLFLFLLNEIKVDSIDFPYYFTVTIIWLGLSYSVNSSKLLRKQ